MVFVGGVSPFPTLPPPPPAVVPAVVLPLPPAPLYVEAAPVVPVPVLPPPPPPLDVPDEGVASGDWLYPPPPPPPAAVIVVIPVPLILELLPLLPLKR